MSIPMALLGGQHALAWPQSHFLDRGDEGVLVAPRADFQIELKRLSLGGSRPDGNEESNLSNAGETARGEGSDLAAALKKAKVNKADADRILTAHAAARAAVQKFAESAEAWVSSQRYAAEGMVEVVPAPQPQRPALNLPEGLPQEFVDYLEGAVIWHDPAVTGKAGARQAWERVLSLPPDQRRWKSTWAAFMLGRSLETNQPHKAIAYFTQVRDLARHGFADSISLARASLGLEARLHLREHEYESAIGLYLDQLAAGDDSAYGSLAISAAAALNADPATLTGLAANPRSQRVITAFLICSKFRRLSDAENQINPSAITQERNWLAAAQRAEIKDRDSAEKLAWIAYRCNELPSASHWLKLIGGSPVAQWIQAKLLLREGKLDQAETILVRCAPAFPIPTGTTNDPPPASLSDNLFVCHWSGDTPAGRQILGELGIVRLARGEYPQALDALLKGGFWMDAAYVAERVLTVDELKNYVDQTWPLVSADQIAQEKEKFGDGPTAPYAQRERIRFLLARRLTRSFRGDVARNYYPGECVTQFDLLAQALRIAWDESVPASDRAVAFVQAAFITRTNGMELLGTEVGPDWHIRDGSSDDGVIWQDRATNYADSKIVRARPEEIRRASQHSANPERRYHYRYQAVLLAWEAAKLMPNESDQTAFVLCKAGSWLKHSDPEVADILYKALVRRNRKTALGAEADVRRWFPDIDDSGNILPTTTTVFDRNVDQNEASSSEGDAAEMSDTDAEIEEFISEVAKAVGEDSNEAVETSDYMIERGDSIASIAARFEVSLEDLLAANPDLNPRRLQIGQIIQVPSPQTDVRRDDNLPRLEYEVRPGDTITAIARAYRKSGIALTVDQILSVNPGIIPERLMAGQRIVIPQD